MTPDTVGLALLLLGALLLVSKLVRVGWKLPQRLHLPGSVIGGGIALLLGPGVLGRLMGWLSDRGLGGGLTEGLSRGGLFGPDVVSVWSALPGLLVSVVFATLFLGKPLPRFRESAVLAGGNLAFGVTVASGQYVIGLLLALLVLAPLFDVPVISGALIEIGFMGGNGTAVGLGDTFDRAGWAEGQDLALGLATVGLLSGIIVGVVLLNRGVRRGASGFLGSGTGRTDKERAGLVERGDRSEGATMTVHPSSIDPLTLHVGLVALAVLVGQLILTGLRWLERALWADAVQVMAYVPLFPLAMVGGALLQLLIGRFDRGDVVDQKTVERIQGLSLDLLILTSIGTVPLRGITADLAVFAILAVAGILWSLCAFLFLAPRMMPDQWFERGLGEFGKSLGITATGLAMMRMVDPEMKSSAYLAFGYKQLIFEPFFAGGLVTAAAIPLILSPHVGPVGFLAIMAAVLAGSLFTGLFVLGRGRRR
ncbi:sodium:glutamate symporter [Nocardiopsis sp. TSRI0078]|uniref:sodium/glutamate symporter n=1 Tax=unclassified Nocardiopsis TaxID=2649073 RepID=UPI00093A8F79|nr:sodium:glutamate symporter [Nocardiopsis sp. TSRI0078]OKI17248.1 sodium:glutamate symporter [Nocardiopsis sp. TSRI0078]